MMKPFYFGEGISIATGMDAVQITFEQRGVEIYLAPGSANGLGHHMQRAAASLGIRPIGGKRTERSHARMLRELERIYERFHGDDKP